MECSPPDCPVCTGAPAVVVAVGHDALRRLILELLDQDRVAWQLHAVANSRDLAAAVSAAGPDLVVLTDESLDWCRELPSAFASQRVVIIGPAPDPAYERTARQAGAGAWLSTDQIGDDLGLSMRRLLGCTHDHAQPAA